MIFVETPILSSSRSPWQRKNEAGFHRTDKEFTINHKRVREWCQCNSTLKGQTRGKRRCLRCDQPLSVDLGHQVSGARGTTELEARADRQLLLVCNIMFLCQHVGVAPEEGTHCEIKCQILHISPPTLSTSAKVAKWGAYMQDTAAYSSPQLTHMYMISHITNIIVCEVKSQQFFLKLLPTNGSD